MMHHKSKIKILIRAANWIGDAIMTTPVIRAIRKSYPDAHITLLAKPWVTPVFDHNPNIDEIMVYQNTTRHARGVGTLRLARDIRKQKFDIAILMQNAFEAALITFLGAVPIRIGYDTDGRGLLLNPSVRLDKRLKKRHLIDYYRAILKGANHYLSGVALPVTYNLQGLNGLFFVDDGRKLDLFISDKDRKEADNILFSLYKIRDAQLYVSTVPPVIGINPGATGGTAKRWFPERYAQLAKRLSERFNTTILIFGSRADQPLGDEIAIKSGDVCVNLAGKTNLRQAFALIEKCDLFITNDSGLMHAAAALGTKQVAVIGSTNHIATAPSSPKSVMIRIPVPCSPCLKSHCPKNQTDFNHHVCMDKISVEMVMKRCESALKEFLNERETRNTRDDVALTRVESL